MVPYQKQKVENSIHFFAYKHKEASGKDLTQTFLYKYLALTEFENLRTNGLPVFGLKYRAMNFGPVPVEIYQDEKFQHTNIYDFTEDLEYRGTGKKIIIELKTSSKPDMDYFSFDEMKIMRRIVREHAHENSTTSNISEHSHEVINSWKTAYSKSPNSFMSYDDEIPTEGDAISREIYPMYNALNGNR